MMSPVMAMVMESGKDFEVLPTACVESVDAAVEAVLEFPPWAHEVIRNEAMRMRRDVNRECIGNE